MPDPRPARPVYRIDTLGTVLDAPLAHEAAVIDALIVGLAKSQPHPELWAKLHEAAQRDDRLAELAFCYEAVARDRKLKTLSPAAQAEVLLHAAEFFADAFGDPEGAETHLTQALSLAPGHPAAFAKLEAILAERQDGIRLVDLYSSAALQRTDRQEQLSMLRRAVEIAQGFAADDARTIKLLSQILKLDPEDQPTRRALEDLYARGGKAAELAKLLEQSLSEASMADAAALPIRTRLLALYGGELGEIERAMPHVEEVLRRDPSHGGARTVAERLLTHKAMAARAAAALESAYERLGDAAKAGRMLEVQVEHLRGPKRLEAQKRLGLLLFHRLGDMARALPLHETVITADPGDDEARARYRTIVAALDKRADATRLLSRAAAGTKDPAVRSRVLAEVGAMFLDLADVKKARAAFDAVLAQGGDDDAVLRSARALARLCADAKEHRPLAGVLERLAQVEPDAAARVAAAERLARLCEDELDDPAGAASAWRRLLDTPLEAQALPHLERLCESLGDHASLVDVLERRARTLTERAARRTLLVRAAELRSEKTRDRAGALEAWRALVAAFGPSREAHARLVPLLEQDRAWEELGRTLEAEASLAPVTERAALFGRLAQVRQRAGDGAGSVDALRQALAADPTERNARAAVERLLATGDQRLAAASILEPIARAETRTPALLVRVLEVRGELGADARARLAALEEAARVAEDVMKDPHRALEVLGRALAVAAEHAPSELADLVAATQRLVDAGAEPARRADVLDRAVLERDLEGAGPRALARQAAEALAAAGETGRAIAVYRRLLAHEPTSAELLARIDKLLAEEGSPEERIALHRAALEEQAGATRRRELLHRIGSIQRRDLGDLTGAIGTFREALVEDPGDRGARDSLVDALEAAGQWGELYDELRGAAGADAGDSSGWSEERVRTGRRLAEVALACGERDTAAGHYRELCAAGVAIDDAVLDAALELAAGGYPELERDVLLRRAQQATDPREEHAILERLAALQERSLGDPAGAVETHRRGGRIAEGAGDAAAAARSWEAVLELYPTDVEAAERLQDLYTQAGSWERLPRVHEILVEAAPGPRARAERVLAYQSVAQRAGAHASFVALADAVLARDEGELGGMSHAIRLAKARVLASDPGRTREAVVAYRAAIEASQRSGVSSSGARSRVSTESASGDPAQAATELTAFLRRTPLDEVGRADLRWLLSWRAEHVPAAERAAALLEWARAEETVLGDAAAASDLFGRVLELAPDDDEALAARARLLLALGDVAAAARVIAARRDRSEGAGRLALELDLADVLVSLGRHGEALDAAASVLEVAPSDGRARGIALHALSDPASRARAVELVTRAADVLEDSASSRAMLEDLLAATAPLSDLRGPRAAVYQRLLSRTTGVEALEAFAIRAASELIHDDGAWESAEASARELGQPERLAAAYGALLAQPPPGTTSAEIEVVGRRAVDHHEEWFDDADEVQALLRRVVRLAPEASWALSRLMLLYNAAERWEELFELYDEALVAARDDDARAALLDDAAQVARDLATEPERAMRYLSELFTLRPDDSRVRASLERLYERHGRPKELVALLGAQLADLERGATRETGEAAQRLRARMGALLLEGIGDPEAAFAVAEAMLAAEPEGAAGCELLERIVAAPAAPRHEPSDPAPRSVRGRSSKAKTLPARQRAAVLLEERWRAEGRTADVVRVLEVQLEAAGSPKDRAKRLREILRLRLEELGDELGAMQALALLLVAEPKAAEHRTELARLAERTGRWDRFAEALVDASDRSDDDKLGVRLLAEAMAVRARRLDDAAGAVEIGYRLLDRAGEGEADVAIEAARDTAATLATLGRYEERCDVLERLAELARDPDVRREALVEAARAAERDLGDAPRAMRAWRRVLAARSDDREALDGLARVLAAEQRYPELCDILALRAGAAESRGDREAARADRKAIARLLDAELGDPAQAEAAWSAIAEHFGHDDEVNDALADLAERAGAWDRLAVLLEQDASRSRERGDRAAASLRRLGDVHRGRTGRLDQAIASYERALEHDPRDADARAGLEAVLAHLSPHAPEDVVLVRAAVLPLSRTCAETDDWQRTISLLPYRLAAAAGDAERVAVLVETSDLLEHRQGDAAAAFDAVWRAFVLSPSVSLSEHAMRLARATGRLGPVADSLDAGLASRADVPASVLRDLWWDVARWRRDSRGDPEGAERALYAGLEHEPAHIEMLSALAELQRRSRRRPLVDTLLRLADATGGDLALYREAAEIATTEVGDPALAGSIAARLLDLATERWTNGVGHMEGDAAPTAGSEPGVVQDSAAWAVDALVSSSRARAPGDEATVRDVYLRAATLPFSPGQRRTYRIRAAELSENAARVALYRELFDEDPADPLVAGRLEALYRSEGRRQDLLALRERQIHVAEAPDTRAALRIEEADLLVEAGDPDRAVAELEQSLAEVPAHAATLVKLSELYEARGRYAELCALWERRATAEQGAASAELWARAGRVASEHLGDMRRALADLSRAAEGGAAAHLDELAAALFRTGAPLGAADVLERRLESAGSHEAEGVALRLADAYEAGGRVDEALVRLERERARLGDVPAVVMRLVSLNEKAERWGPLAELTASAAARAETRAERIELLRRAAELHLERRADPLAAVPLLEQAAALAPDDTTLQMTLASALGRAGQFDAGAKILERLITGYAGRRPKERALVHFELARVSLASGDRARALGELDVALKIDPAHPEILSALARLAVEEGQLERAQRTLRALLLVLRGREADKPGGPRRSEVLLELAAIALRQGEEERASEHLESAFDAARDSGAELASLAGALRERGMMEPLARALEARVSRDPAPEEAKAALEELATLYEEHLGRPGDALEALLGAVALSPEDAAAHQRCISLARRMGAVTRYVAALRAQCDATPSPTTYLFLGRALEEDLSEDALAVEVVRRAEALLADAGRPRTEAWRALERIHERAGDRDALFAVLEERASAVRSTPAPAPERADPLYRLAALALGRVETRARGQALLDEALRIDPQPERAERVLLDVARAERPSPDIVDLLERFARDAARPAVLIEALVLRAALPGSGPGALREAVEIAMRAGERGIAESILRRVPGLVAGATAEASAEETTEVEAVTSGRDTRPSGEASGAEPAWALSALADLREADGDLAEAALLRERAAASVDAAEARGLLLGVARLAAGPLADLDRAARVYERLWEHEPADRDLWAPLADVYRRASDSPRLGALLEQVLPLVDDRAERASMILELARLRLPVDPGIAKALWRQLLDEDATQVEAMEQLAALLEREGRYEELCGVLERQLVHAKDRDDVRSIVALSMRLGALHELRGDEHAALDVYHGALDWDVASRDALRAIVRLGLVRDDSIEIGDALDKLLAVEQGEQAAVLAQQLCELKTAHGDVGGAELALAQGWRSCPGHAALREELASRYTSRGAWLELADLWVQDASARDAPADKVESLCRAAETLRDHARDPRRAADVLARALSVDPTDRDVLLALVDACTETGQYPRAIEAIGSALATAPDDPWLHRSRAALHEAAGDHDGALVDLERAYGSGGGAYASELVVQLVAAIARASDAASVRDPESVKRARALRLRLAEVLHHTGDVDGAREPLAEIVRADPRDKAALRALASLESNAARWDAASAALRKLIPLEDGDALVEVALALAAACERAGRPGDARAALERAARVAPSHAGVREWMHRVYDLTGASRELAGLILEDAAGSADVRGRFVLLVKAGRLLLEAEGGGDVPRATAVLEQALALAPEDPDALDLLAETYSRSSRLADGLALLRAAIARQRGRRSKGLATLHRAVSRLELADGDLSASLEGLVKAFECDPGNAQLALELGEAAMDLDDADIAQRAFRSVTIMKSMFPGGPQPEGAPPSAKAAAYYHLGRIAEAQGDRRKARMMVEKAVAEDPDLAPAQALLRALRS